jgi:peptidoglycan-associated lipoprotein
MAQFKIVRYALVAVFLLTAAGCAPSTAKKPDTAAASSSTSPGSKGKSSAGQGEGQRGGSRESQTSPGSLDALQQGKSTATPASSPLQDIYFEFDRYNLQPDARETLKANAGWLKGNPSARIEVEGHCDERGTNEYNLALGAKRAQAAKDFLVTLGIPAERVSTISYGEEIPVCKQATEDCWRQNRRARFVIITTRPAS